VAFDDARASLSVVTAQVRDAGGVLYLLVHTGQTTRETRISRQAKHMADIVFEYRRAADPDGNDALVIPKFRPRHDTDLELPERLELNVKGTLTVSEDVRV
jgi:hypothetical protein